MTSRNQIRTANAAGKFFWFKGYVDLPEAIVKFKCVSDKMSHAAEVLYYSTVEAVSFTCIQIIHLTYLQEMDQDTAKAILMLKGYMDEDGRNLIKFRGRGMPEAVTGNRATTLFTDELT